MNTGLLEAKGAQPVKPSRYKPIWTDRFFTGLFTNRSPFRSPLSAYYADGWNLGRTDTLLQGANVEVSPRLTIARRPGSTKFCQEVIATNPVNNFYSFNQSNTDISLYFDTDLGVYGLNPLTTPLLYTKTSGATQTHFQGVGTQLYWGDETIPKAYDTVSGTVRNIGLSAPQAAPGVQAVVSSGSAAQPIGVNFNGGYMRAGTLESNYTTCSIECWIKTSAVSNPIASFQTPSGGVFQSLFIDSAGNLNYSVFDVTTNALIGIDSFKNVADGNWHLITVAYQYVPENNQAISLNNGAPTANLSSAAQNAQLTNGINITTITSQIVSAAAAPAQFQMFMWVDGIQVSSGFPLITPSSNPGYWYVANNQNLASSNIIISEVTIRNQMTCGMLERFNGMMFGLNISGGLAVYETAVADSNASLLFWWKLNETSGTVATDSHGTNNGTYMGTYTLDQHPAVQYVPYAASTAFILGQLVVDSNGNLQNVTTAGTSGSAAPTWNTSVSGTTTDGSVVWTNMIQAGLVTTITHQWCYCYVDRFGNYSTASAPSVAIGPFTKSAQFVKVFALGTPQPTVTQIAFFRTEDGGSTFFYVDSVPNETYTIPGDIGFYDTFTDAQLNILMAAPISHANDQPPQGLHCLTYHLGRIWGAVNNILYASGGPDTLVGNGNEAWPPANSWNYPANIVKLIPSSSGLVVLTRSGIWMHAGGPAITQFYAQPLYEKIGIASYNAADIRGTQISIFSTDQVAFTFDLSTNTLNDIGYAIADQLKLFDPFTTYVVFHRKGDDNALYYADGATGWYRCVPQQPPDYSITGPVWSPKADVLPLT